MMDIKDGWQPIETAPRNGVPVLCLNNDTGEIRVGVRKTFSEAHYERTDRHRYRWFRSDEFCPGHTWSIEATHWMPLPSPPKAARQSETGDPDTDLALAALDADAQARDLTRGEE